MVGTATYTPEEIEYVLNCVLDNKRHESITRGFQRKYGRPLSANQVRYLKNKYGTSPLFNCPLVNSAKARTNNPRRRRRREQADKDTNDEPQQLSDAQVEAIEAHGSSDPFSSLHGSDVMSSSAANGQIAQLQTNNTVAGLGIKHVTPIQRRVHSAARHLPTSTVPPGSYPPLCLPQSDIDWTLDAISEVEFPSLSDFSSDFVPEQQSNVYNSFLNTASGTYQPHLDFNFNSLLLPDLPTHRPSQSQWIDPYPNLVPPLPASDLDFNLGQSYWASQLSGDASVPIPPQTDLSIEQDTWMLNQQSQNWETDPTLPLQLDGVSFADPTLDPNLSNIQDLVFDDIVNPTLFSEPLSSLDSYNEWIDLRQGGNSN